MVAETESCWYESCDDNVDPSILVNSVENGSVGNGDSSEHGSLEYGNVDGESQENGR